MKLTLTDVASLRDPTTATTTINSNSDLIETALENTLSLDGTTPNTMSASIDMDSNRILNLPLPVASTEPVRLADLNTIAADGFITKDVTTTFGIGAGEVLYSDGTNIQSSPNTVITTNGDGTFLSAVNPTFLDCNVIHPTRPFIYMSATSLGSNKGAWNQYILDGDTTGTWRFAAMDDTGFHWNDAFWVTRSGYVPQTVQFWTPVRVAGELTLFGAFTDNANYHGLDISYTGSLYQLTTAHAGTGSAKDILIARDSGTYITLGSASLTITSGKTVFAATTTARATLNLPTGTAPTSPVDGDVWREDNTNTGLKIRINGVTKTITVS